MRKTRLKQLNETVSQFIDIFQSMANPEIAVHEDWSAKDILGHITFWHESFARNVRDVANGVEPKPLKGRYPDLNQRCLDEMRPRTVKEIIQRLQVAHRVIQDHILTAKLGALPYKKGSRDYSPEEHLEIVNEHIQEHLASIEKAQ